MSLTPAEIIAARVNGVDNSDSEDTHSFGEESMTTSIPSIVDESAFPPLGGKKPNVSPNNWVKDGVSTVPVPVAPVDSSSKPYKFKSSTIQDAFSLDAEDQLNVSRPEFIKLLTGIKTDTKTNIECTTSQHTQKRTFLITGKPEDVKIAKRLVIKKLTKAVKISFSVPSKLRSVIIGPQGKNLRPIITEYDVKVDIGKEETVNDEDDEDIFSRTIEVSIEGDVESSKLAKTKILNIVKSETKNISLKLAVEEKVKPFALNYLEDIVSQYADLDILIPDYKSAKSVISILGERELALKARDEINAKLTNLASKIVIDEVPIPKLKHQFLPIEKILNEDNVLIKLPAGSEPTVQFIGEKSKINIAKEKARNTTSQFKVEALDMSKAHKSNLNHVRAIADYLNTTGFFKTVGNSYNVNVKAPTKQHLVDTTNTSIPIEIIYNSSDISDDAVKSAKKEIVSKVNSLTPGSTKLITDIDEFLIARVPESTAALAKSLGVSVVVLNSNITLFSEKESDTDDFGDDSTTEDFEKVDAALNPLRELKSQLDSHVLAIDASKQKFVKATLHSILSELEPNSVIIKLASNGINASANEVYIHGLKSQVSIAKKLIESAVQDGEEFGNSYTSSITVPSSVLSRLIGKNGANLNALRDEFNIKIDVVDDDEESKTKSEISLVGPKKNVEAGKVKISSLSKKWADETTVILKVEPQYHRRIIGPSGVYVNRLQDKYGVKIRFPSGSEKSNEITIRGASRGVASAKEEIEDLYKFEKENGFVENIQIPLKAIARIIGKNGETINDISDGFGIEYKFDRDTAKEEESGFVEMKLTGSRTGLKQAISKINEIIEEAENFVSIEVEVDAKYHRELVGHNSSKLREFISNAGGDDISPRSRYNRLLNIPNEGSGSNIVKSQGPKAIVNKIIEQINEFISIKEASINEEVEIPKDKHRFLIGPGGSIRRSLEQEFGCSISIPKQTDDSHTIKLTGLPDKMSALKEKLTELTKDDWNHSIDIPEQYHSLVSERGSIFNTLKSEYNVSVSHENSARKATKLNRSSIPLPPSELLPEQGETKKFIVSEASIDSSDNVIPWKLKGEADQTARALEFLTERLELAKESTFNGWFYSSKPSVFAKLIGPQGSVINNIRSKSKTFITIPRASDVNSNYVYLVGSKDNLVTAKKLIEKLT